MALEDWLDIRNPFNRIVYSSVPVLTAASIALAQEMTKSPEAASASILSVAAVAIAPIASVAGNSLAEAISNKFFNRQKREDILQNGDLEKAVGDAICATILNIDKKLYTDANARLLKKLSNVPAEIWQQLVEELEVEKDTFHNLSIEEIEKLLPKNMPDIFAIPAKRFNDAAGLDAKVWEKILRKLCDLQGISLSNEENQNATDTITLAAETLEKDFRNILKHAIISNPDGKAYANLQLKIVGEVLYLARETHENSKETLSNTKEILKKINDLEQRNDQIIGINSLLEANGGKLDDAFWKRAFDLQTDIFENTEELLNRTGRIEELLRKMSEMIESLTNQSKTQPLPNSIPSSQNFVGREDYLKALRESYERKTRCFVLHGIGGIGKSALALQFAEEIAGEHAAKILVDMQGMSETPLSARDAMFDIVVRQFEHEAAPDILFAQLKSLFVKLVQSQPTLIVLDNAENKEAVESLKDAKACLIITSRQRIYLNDEPFEILAMTDSDAIKLLLKNDIKNRVGEYAGEIARECGNLPLALNVIKALLMNQRFPRVPEFIEKFKKEKLAHLSEVEASFNLSYKNISEELQKRWRQLSVFPTNFDAEATAAVWEVDLETAEKTLEALESYSLIEIFSSNQAKSSEDNLRIRLHDLAREFTTAKISDDERFQAQFLHARYYASVLRAAQDMQTEKQENYYLNALKLIDTEWNNITAGQKWTAEHLEKDKNIVKLYLYYSGSARDFIILRLLPRNDIIWLENALTAARKLGDHSDEGNSLGDMGNAYLRLGDYRKAIDYHEQSLIISREIGNRLGEGASLGNLGTTYANLGDYRKAIDYHEQSLTISREIGNRSGEGASLSNLGTIYTNLGDYRKAIDYHEQSLTISREIGNRSGEGISLGSLGNAYFRSGKYWEVIDYHEQHLAISREIGDRLGEGNSLGNLGNAYGRLGDYRKAIDYHEQSLTISREIGDRSGEGNSLGSLGNAYFKLGEKEKACGLWKEALAIFEVIESPTANVVRQLIKENCES
jgi:tetratricopeptide (TPR) repeat protein